MTLMESLSHKREFRVFIPDITLKEAMKNEPYVLRVMVPKFAEFLEVVQIQDPFAGISALGVGNAPQTAYAFLVDPTIESDRRFYLTAVFPHQPFPWPVDHHTRQALCDEMPVECQALGITTHSGVPILHVQTAVMPSNYELFEKELQEFGYRIVESKPYTKSEALVQLYKANSAKVQAVLDGKPTQDDLDQARMEGEAP